ncbi:hypothetical protein ACFU7X_14150 [Streptomyces chartreusis]|uniref:hypothetical protein n=1 Tax=Streptomyces chartreusis TaxID=1969 RepID=UPI0036B0BF58
MLACWFGVDRSTITRTIGQVRTLLAQRGCTVAPAVRLGSLAEVIEHLGADGRTGNHRRHGDPRATPGRRPQGRGQVRLRDESCIPFPADPAPARGQQPGLERKGLPPHVRHHGQAKA